MLKFEYLIKEYEFPIRGYDLNQLGAAGWELSAAIEHKIINDSYYYYYFKRSIDSVGEVLAPI